MYIVTENLVVVQYDFFNQLAYNKCVLIKVCYKIMYITCIQYHFIVLCVFTTEPEPFKEYTLYETSDFPGVADKAVLVFDLLKILLKKISQVGKSIKELDQWPAMLHVCYVFMEPISGHVQPNLWTNETSQKTAKECLDLLMKEFSCSTVCKLLNLDTKHVLPVIENDTSYNTAVKRSVFGKLLIQWKSNLQRNSWKLNPVTAFSFRWCLCQVEFPHLSNFIELTLPPVLQFLDDHTLENKMSGTKCLIHMLNNCGAEELRWNGRAEVIYSALKQQLLLTEDLLLPLTHETMLLVLKILVTNPSELGVTTKYDEVFTILLQAARHENKLTLRRIHTQPLHVFIEELGINSVKYTKLILEIFEEYLEISDAPSELSRLNVLLAIKSFIRVTYPRINNYSRVLLKMMVKLLHEVTRKKLSIEDDVEKQLVNECKECIELLKIVDESSMQGSDSTCTKDEGPSQTCADGN